MTKKIIINTHPWETRAVVMEGDLLTNIYIERPKELGVSGNIYLGRVIRVLPGMESAFVNIGLEKAAFLYVTDYFDDYSEFEGLLDFNNGDDRGERQIEATDVAPSIEGLVRKGQDVLVQVSREPFGEKGARITSHISLPGRYLVFLPTMDRVGVSRRIDDETERKRLKKIVEELRPEDTGFIVRTAGRGIGEGEIKGDMDFLLRLWGAIMKKRERVSSPVLVHRELDLSLRLVRDLLTREVETLLVDSDDEYRRLSGFADEFLPGISKKIELYDGDEPIFDCYGLETEIRGALSERIGLKSGGYIVIEETEALTSIDVNTGRFVGKRNLEETILRTNLEASGEIAYQLRLRNIGGIIIIDFIDMEKAKNREAVYRALENALKLDTKKTNVLKISELGIVEMTRKRSRKSIPRVLTSPCPYCDGSGYVKSRSTICYEIFRELIKEGRVRTDDRVTVMVNPEVAGILYDEERENVEMIEESMGVRVVIRALPDLHLEEFDIV